MVSEFSTVGSRLGSVSSSSDGESLLSESLGSSDTRPSVIGGRSDNHRQRGDGHDGEHSTDKYVHQSLSHAIVLALSV